MSRNKTTMQTHLWKAGYKQEIHSQSSGFRFDLTLKMLNFGAWKESCFFWLFVHFWYKHRSRRLFSSTGKFIRSGSRNCIVWTRTTQWCIVTVSVIFPSNWNKSNRITKSRKLPSTRSMSNRPNSCFFLNTFLSTQFIATLHAFRQKKAVFTKSTTNKVSHPTFFIHPIVFPVIPYQLNLSRFIFIGKLCSGTIKCFVSVSALFSSKWTLDLLLDVLLRNDIFAFFRNIKLVEKQHEKQHQMGLYCPCTIRYFRMQKRQNWTCNSRNRQRYLENWAHLARQPWVCIEPGSDSSAHARYFELHHIQILHFQHPLEKSRW